QLLQYALQLGSDAPFFIINKPGLGKGRGEKLTPIELSLSAYTLLLVHPGIQVSTPWAFSQITPRQPVNDLAEIIQQPADTWKDQLINDFEPVVFSKYPAIAEIKTSMYQHGAIYASMSGSGSAVFGIFEKSHLTAFTFPEHYFVRVVNSL
ncbi:MAG: 4-(cytidine 5'-diphospho)-2-C-methyl-D-erythritol kinase, partial [Pedobacter sp.]